ncbi:MAG: thioredoxin [Candidatus Lokiarchaeota archaeon]|nr:thioredoxin [Candidatus Lokiarchaeota archaeon]
MHCKHTYEIMEAGYLLSDDELEAIRRRKMELLMERAKKAKEPKPEVREPLSKGYPIQLNDGNFWQTIQQTKVALVDFYGEWCQPCKMLAPIIQELAEEFKGKAVIAKIDIDRNPRVTGQFGVQSVPMVIVFKDGKPAGQLPGLRPYNQYDSVISQLL